MSSSGAVVEHPVRQVAALTVSDAAERLFTNRKEEASVSRKQPRMLVLSKK